jgi:two-component system, OmpR family, sensor histidine kinase VicK
VSPGLPPAVLFGAHLVILLVTVAAAVALARERARRPLARAAGAVGFLALAGAEAIRGAGLVGEADPLVSWIRLGGYAALLVAALPSSAPAGAAAVVAVPGGTIALGAAGLAAGLLTVVRRRGQPAGPWLGAGIMLFGIAELVSGMDRAWASPVSVLVRVVGCLAVARTVLAITRHRLRFRFLAGFTGLLLAVVLFVSLAIGTVIDRNLREGALERLVGQAEDARRNLVDLVSDEVGTLVVLGEVQQIADTIRAGGAVPDALITELRDRLLPDVDFVLFLDRHGEIRGRTGLDRARAVEVVGTEVVDFALRGGTVVSSLDELSGGGLAMIGVAPIRPPGAPGPAGFAVAGFMVDEEILAREVIAGRGTRAAAFQGFRGAPPALVAAAGFPGVEDPSAPPALLRRTFLRFLEGEGTVGRALKLGGTDHFAALAPLRQEVGQPVGILVVAEPAGVLAATRRAVNQVLFLVAVAVMGLAFLVAVAAARRITGPLSSLTEAARRVQAGNLEAKAEVRGEDEVGDLSVAFNQMTGSVATMTEELRVAADEQSRLRARLETVLDSMGDGLLAVDADGTVSTSNPAAAVILGRPRGEITGLPLGDALLGRDASGRSLEELAWSPDGLAFVDRPGGDQVPVAISSAPLRDVGGARIGRVYVLRDMSLEYQVERMKREFLANVSHELRTPLTPIIGYSELMMKRDLPGEQSKEFAASILESARRLERIVGMLVDFSAIEAGRLPMAIEPLEVGPVLDEAAEAWRRRSEQHRFDVDVPSPLPAAQVNPSLFRRMLDELVDNAVKYSPEGGTVRIGVASRNSNDRPMLRIEVTDEGIGIEPGDLAGIFEGFSQVDASDTRSFGGLGLGLTFVKRLAEAHGGAVAAESLPGRGSSFSFTVPAADVEGKP